MPTAPPRACPKCGRAHSNPRGCPRCRPAWQGSSWTGGSTRQWRTLRANQLATHPFCQWSGCRRAAVEVDHVVNLAAGGERYDPANLQSLCTPHHEAKTQAEARGGPDSADDCPF